MGGHDINGKFFVLDLVNEDPETYECLLVTNDSRASGTVYLTWRGEDTPDGQNTREYFDFVVNEGGDDGWIGECEAIRSRDTSEYTDTEFKPYQALTRATATGWGDYEGYSLTLTFHRAWGQSPFIVKGSIEPIE